MNSFPGFAGSETEYRLRFYGCAYSCLAMYLDEAQVVLLYRQYPRNWQHYFPGCDVGVSMISRPVQNQELDPFVIATIGDQALDMHP